MDLDPIMLLPFILVSIEAEAEVVGEYPCVDLEVDEYKIDMASIARSTTHPIRNCLTLMIMYIGAEAAVASLLLGLDAMMVIVGNGMGSAILW